MNRSTRKGRQINSKKLEKIIRVKMTKERNKEAEAEVNK